MGHKTRVRGRGKITSNVGKCYLTGELGKCYLTRELKSGEDQVIGVVMFLDVSMPMGIFTNKVNGEDHDSVVIFCCLQVIH